MTPETIQNSPYASYLEDLCEAVFEQKPLAIGACLLMEDGSTMCCYNNAGWMEKLMMMGSIQTDAMMDAIKHNRDETDAMMDAIKHNRDEIEAVWSEDDDEEDFDEDGELDDG